MIISSPLFSSSVNKDRQSGASLVFVMIILTVVSLLGAAGIQVSMMSERGARNERDMQIAFQSAEAALLDAEYDLLGPVGSSPRKGINPSKDPVAFSDPTCGSTGDYIGLCPLSTAGLPSWLLVDFNLPNTTSHTTEFGAYTGQLFQAGTGSLSDGVKPARKPRYVIEPILDYGHIGAICATNTNADPCTHYVYRVTAMGFGTRSDIQAVLQMIYRPI